ncbi:RING-type domain-containing protein [Haematococcus lacustris]|uniref:RING-type domain-containing protein n=1 Tax=Haematococcus lacustris TaxID=44745 RepID=A0A6A0AFH1_HAELA|nr:RING-type domain-containing protein [Haematococcus lacustris]
MPGTQAPHQARAAPEAVLLALRKLATEEYAGPAELEQMSVHALKGRLAARGIDCSKAVEKRELLTLLEADGGSSASSCSVCCEDYVAGDAVRVLGCRHKYHVECIDRWLLTATDYSRQPACPMCNHPLLSSTT